MTSAPEYEFDVYVCHAACDRKIAEDLVYSLEARGLRCWLASDNSRLGEEYRQATMAALRRSRNFILLLSRAARDSRRIRAEAECAKHLNIGLYSLRLEDIRPGKSLTACLSKSWKIDLFEGDRSRHWAMLAGLVGKRAARKSHRHIWWRYAVRVVVYSLIAIVLLDLDFLGYGRSTDEWSQDIFYKIVAPQYGKGFFGPKKPKEPKEPPWNRNITVLMLDDDLRDLTRQNYNRGANPLGCEAEIDFPVKWPVPFCFHAMQIRDLYRTYRPRAIMIDLLFLDRRNGQEKGLIAFGEVLREIEKHGDTKVYLAAPGDGSDLKVLRELAENAIPAPVDWPREAGSVRLPLLYPTVETPGIGIGPKTPVSYLKGKLFGKDDDPSDELELPYGPAYLMYRNLCRNRNGRKNIAHCPPVAAAGDDFTDAFDSQFISPMQVFWGAVAPDLNWDQANRGILCQGMTPSIAGRFVAFVSFSLSGTSDQYPQTCPYAQVIKVRDFADGAFRGLRDVDEAYKSALGGSSETGPKVVFYGTNFVGASGQVASPVHGRIPEVYFHAMALDNLMTFGRDYIRATDSDDRLVYLRLALIVLLSVLSVAFEQTQNFLLHQNLPANVIGRITPWCVGWIGWVLGLVSLMLAFSYVFFVSLRLGPVNWIGFVGVAALLKLIGTATVDHWIDLCFARLRRDPRK